MRWRKLYLGDVCRTNGTCVANYRGWTNRGSRSRGINKSVKKNHENSKQTLPKTQLTQGLILPPEVLEPIEGIHTGNHTKSISVNFMASKRKCIFYLPMKIYTLSSSSLQSWLQISVEMCNCAFRDAAIHGNLEI